MSGDPSVIREIVPCDGMGPVCRYWGPHAHLGRVIAGPSTPWFRMDATFVWPDGGE